MNAKRSADRRRFKCGFSLLEMGVALAILSVAAVALVQLVSVATRQRRAGYQRLAATMEIANQAERIALLDWDSIAPDKLTTWPPSDVLQAAIPESDRRIKVTDQMDGPVSRRIDLYVSWL